MDGRFSRFYALLGVAAVYAALTGSGTAARGMSTIEVGADRAAAVRDADAPHHAPHRLELPMAGDVVADCVRLLVRLYVARSWWPRP